MHKNGEGFILNQFANKSNYLAHYDTTGPEIWNQTDRKITHFVSAMGTTGTITGVSRYLKEQDKGIQIIGVQPTEGSRIPGFEDGALSMFQKYSETQKLIILLT